MKNAIRHLARSGWFIEHLLAPYPWGRKLLGGHWERWFIEPPICSDIWVRNAHGTRPIGARGTPTCEQWP